MSWRDIVSSVDKVNEQMNTGAFEEKKNFGVAFDSQNPVVFYLMFTTLHNQFLVYGTRLH